MIIRKNAKDLGGAEKKAFTDAVLALKAQPSQLHPADKTRGRYDDFVEVHLNAMTTMMHGDIQNWGHQSSAFGPWHRVYLAHFERELRATSPAAASVVLPYWDWTDISSTNAVFSADLLGSNGRHSDHLVVDGPFAASAGHWKIVVKDEPTWPDHLRRNLGADKSAKALPSNAQQDAVLAITTYDEAPWYDSVRTPPVVRANLYSLFRLGLEYVLHNLVHRYVGGDMGTAASPNDPVFWLHHCNLDRLWSLWEQTTGKAAPYAPMTGGPAGQSGDLPLIYAFPSGTLPWLGTAMPQDVYDSQAQLQIGYDTDVVSAQANAPAELAMKMPMPMPMPMRPMTPREMYPLPDELLDTCGMQIKFHPNPKNREKRRALSYS